MNSTAIKRTLSLLLSLMLVLSLLVPITVNATYTPADGDFAEYVKNHYDNSDVFVADSIVDGIDSSNPIISQSLLANRLYMVMAEAATEDTGLMFASTYWKESESFLSGDFVSMVGWQTMFYETLLMDYLTFEAGTDEFKDDFEKKTMKYSKKVFDTVLKEAEKQYEEGIDDILDRIMDDMTISDAVEFSKNTGILTN